MTDHDLIARINAHGPDLGTLKRLRAAQKGWDHSRLTPEQHASLLVEEAERDDLDPDSTGEYGHDLRGLAHSILLKRVRPEEV